VNPTHLQWFCIVTIGVQNYATKVIFLKQRLTLKTTLADISAATNTRKQSAVTFKVFVLWLPNQHYYICDSIGIKMTYRDLRYYEGIRAKTRCECKLHENKHENHTNHLHTFRKWSTTWSQFVL